MKDRKAVQEQDRYMNDYPGPSRVFSGRSNGDLYCGEETDISKMTSYGFEGWPITTRHGWHCDQSIELCNNIGITFREKSAVV
jgi:hypothetical protein